MKRLLFTLIIASTLIYILSSCTEQPASKNNKLVVFHAGSLSVPFKQIVEEYKKIHPEAEILLEPAGSRKCAKKITDLKKKCDVMASADYKVIENLLIPEYAKWNIKFVSNEMTIVYHDKSKYSNEINSKNWYKILLKKDVAIGRSNPDTDPCGYRSILTVKLAEKYYNFEGYADSVLSKDNCYIRPKETDLLALLESCTIDYLFLYRSVAEQHGLKFIILPDSVNLKNPEISDFYSTASTDISGKSPGEIITKKGEPMVYGITIPDNAPNKAMALDFVEFVLSQDKGIKILENNGQPSMVPSPTESFDNIPGNLKKFATR